MGDAERDARRARFLGDGGGCVRCIGDPGAEGLCALCAAELVAGRSALEALSRLGPRAVREREALRLRILGFDRQEIGRRLGIRPRSADALLRRAADAVAGNTTPLCGTSLRSSSGGE